MNRLIKMVGMDLDGTLLNSQKKLSEYTRKILAQAIEQGCIVLAATGRPLSALPKDLIDFPGMKYAVTTNGARVLDMERKETIYANLLPMDIAQQVLSVYQEYDVIDEVFINGIGYTHEEPMRRVDEYADNPTMANYMLTTRTLVKDVGETIQRIGEPIDKVRAIFKHSEERQEAIKRLQEIPGIEISASSPNDLDANKSGINKGLALVKLGEFLGIKREEIMACGDDINDLEMLREVGFAVAVENARDEVKNIADYITDTNDNDGVAKAIERFVLKRKEK